MATFTTNYNFGLPIVGGDKNAWGQFLNANWVAIDTLLKTASDTSAAALPRAGGTMTGQIVLSADPVAALNPVTKQYADAADTALSTRVTAAQTRADVAVANAALAQSTADAKVPSVGDTIKTGAFTLQSGSLTVLNGNAFIGGGLVKGSGTEIGFYNNAGTIGCKMTIATGDFTASGNVIAYSDEKLKKNVRTIKDAVNIVNRMRGVFYDRIDTGVAQVGVIAQEMQEVLPQVVTSSDGTLGVAYGNLTAVLIEAVKELSDRVAELEAR